MQSSARPYNPCVFIRENKKIQNIIFAFKRQRYLTWFYLSFPHLTHTWPSNVIKKSRSLLIAMSSYSSSSHSIVRLDKQYTRIKYDFFVLSRIKQAIPLDFLIQAECAAASVTNNWTTAVLIVCLKGKVRFCVRKCYTKWQMVDNKLSSKEKKLCWDIQNKNKIGICFPSIGMCHSNK